MEVPRYDEPRFVHVQNAFIRNGCYFCDRAALGSSRPGSLYHSAAGTGCPNHSRRFSATPPPTTGRGGRSQEGSSSRGPQQSSWRGRQQHRDREHRERLLQQQQQQPRRDKPAQAPVDPNLNLFAKTSRSSSVSAADIGKYYPLDEVRISEAFDAWYQNRSKKPHKPVTAEGKDVPAESKFVAGCRGLQEEFAQSGYPYVMHRQQHQALWQILVAPTDACNPEYVEQIVKDLEADSAKASSSDDLPQSSAEDAATVESAAASEDAESPPAQAASGAAESDADEAEPEGIPAGVQFVQSMARVLVGGPPGGGKSVLLASTAEVLRQLGWIVMYIPDASDITLKSKFFSKNEATGMFDTRDSGQNILRAMRDAHGEQLAQQPQRLAGGSGTLLDLCNVADKGTDASVCNAVVRLKLELYKLPATSVRTAVIIDNYNSLFWKTHFSEVEGFNTNPEERVDGHREFYNRPVDAQELTLAANLRVLGDLNNGDTACIVAGSTSGQVPMLPYDVDKDDYIRVSVPLMSVTELGTMLRYYRYVHALAPEQEITLKGIAAAHLLTQGNGFDTRRNLHFLLPYDPLLADLDRVGAQQAAAAGRS